MLLSIMKKGFKVFYENSKTIIVTARDKLVRSGESSSYHEEVDNYMEHEADPLPRVKNQETSSSCQ